MPVIYDGSKIIPVSTCTYREEYTYTESGDKEGVKFPITLQGTLVAYKGSPTSSGTFWTTTGYPPDETIAFDSRLAAIINKQEALRCLFSHEGKLLEVQPFDGSPAWKCVPRVLNLEFSPGPWFDKCDFTVTLEADKIYNNLNPNCPPDFTPANVSDPTDEWQIESNDAPFSYRLTHNVSAKGKKEYDSAGNLVREGWQNAQLWVQARLGIDTNRVTASGVLDLPSYYQGYNYVRGETVSKFNGAYSVSESWIVASGNALEDYTIEARTDQDGKTKVTINGTVTGLETRNNTTWAGPSQYKFDAASGVFGYTTQPNLYNRAKLYSGLNLNPAPLTKVIGRNPVGGTITYSFEFDDRAAALVDGSKSETLNIIDDNQADVFAIVPVIGRSTGPVLQTLGARTEKRRTISMDVVMGGRLYASGALTAPRNAVAAIIANYIPNASDGPTANYVVFKEKDNENWEVLGGRYSRSVSYVYE